MWIVGCSAAGKSKVELRRRQAPAAVRPSCTRSRAGRPEGGRWRLAWLLAHIAHAMLTWSRRVNLACVYTYYVLVYTLGKKAAWLGLDLDDTLAFHPSWKTGFAILLSRKVVLFVYHYEPSVPRWIAIWGVLIGEKKRRPILPLLPLPVLPFIIKTDHWSVECPAIVSPSLVLDNWWNPNTNIYTKCV